MSQFKHFSLVGKSTQLKRLRIEHLSHGVVRLVMSRPEVRNAFDEVFIAEFISALKELAEDSALRLLVIQGEGHVFSAGADLGYMQRQAAQSFEKNFEDAKVLGTLFLQVANFPTPVLAAVRGAAIGGGFGLAACADACLSEAGAVFAMSEVRLGLVPGVIGPYVFRKLALAWAQKLMLAGVRVTAEELLPSGLISNLVKENESFDDALENEMNKYLQASPVASRRCKQLILDCNPLPSEIVTLNAARHIALARSEPDASEGLKCFFEKVRTRWQMDLPKERV